MESYEFYFEDYSKEYYEKIGQTGLPAFRKGKFVQIRRGKCEHIIFSPVELTRYHANIVERFCLKNGGIPNRTSPSGDCCSILDEGWKIVGGGYWKATRCTLTLYGKSLAYGSFERHDSLCGNLKEKTGFSTVIFR